MTWEQKNFVKVNKFFKKISFKPAIFLDRDGVLNEDFGYVFKYNQIRWIKKTINILQRMRHLNIYFFIVTNQSGIGRNYYTTNDFNILHKKMKNFLSKKKFLLMKCFFVHIIPLKQKVFIKKNVNVENPIIK